MKKLYVLLAIIICLTIVVLCLWRNQEYDYNTDNEFNIQSELFEEIKPDDTSVDNTSQEHDIDYLSECKKINPDTVAWLSIPDTPIDFPVVQSEDNEYYLSHNFEKESSSYGVPFLDYRCNSDFSDFNSIIYGHNIKGEKMFAGLLNFQDKEYFNSHSYGYLLTENGNYKINFIACLILKNDSFVYNTVFLTEHEKEIFIQDIQASATQYRDFSSIDLSEMNFITLSTCSYEFTDARTILIGLLEKN